MRLRRSPARGWCGRRGVQRRVLARRRRRRRARRRASTSSTPPPTSRATCSTACARPVHASADAMRALPARSPASSPARPPGSSRSTSIDDRPSLRRHRHRRLQRRRPRRRRHRGVGAPRDGRGRHQQRRAPRGTVVRRSRSTSRRSATSATTARSATTRTPPTVARTPPRPPTARSTTRGAPARRATPRHAARATRTRGRPHRALAGRRSWSTGSSPTSTKPATRRLPPLGNVVTLSSPHEGAPLATVAAQQVALDPLGRAALDALEDVSSLPPPSSPAVQDLAEGSPLIAAPVQTRGVPDHFDFTTSAPPKTSSSRPPTSRCRARPRPSRAVDGVNQHSAIVRAPDALRAVRAALEGRPPPCVGVVHRAARRGRAGRDQPGGAHARERRRQRCLGGAVG